MRQKKKTLKFVSILLMLSLLIGSFPLEVIAQNVTEKGETISEVQSSENHEIKKEVVSERTENTKTFLREDGTKTVVVSPERLHCYDEKNDEWLEIDNTLQTDPSNKDTITNMQNELQVELPKELDSDSPVVVSNNKHSISFKLKDDIKASSAKIENDVIETSKNADEIEKHMNRKDKHSRINYADVLKDTSLVYDVKPSSLKESIILNKCPKGELKYTYQIETDGLIGKLLKDNSIEFYEKGGKEPVFVLPVPYMFDSNPKAPETSTDIELMFNQMGTGIYELTYVPSGEWLKDQKRVWPVSIDPTVTLNASEVMFSPESAHIYGENICFKYPNLPELSNHVITNAEFRLNAAPLNQYLSYEELKLYELTSSWSTVQNGTYIYKPEMAAVSKGPDYKFNITALANKWYAEENFGMMVSLPSGMRVLTPLSGEYGNYYFYLTIDYAEPVPAQGLAVKRFYGVPGVYSPTGNYSETFTDMTVRTVLGDIDLSRTFNSLDMVGNSTVGKGFSFNYSMRVVNDSNHPGGKYVIMPGGARWRFEEKANGQYETIDSCGKLTRAADYRYILATLDQKRYGFDSNGYLEYIEDQYKNRLNFKTTLGRITDIEDSTGASIHFNYSSSFLQSITDSVTGRTVSYEYKDGRLTQVTDTGGRKTIYEYNTDGLLNGVTLASPDSLLKQKTVTLTYSDGLVKAITDGGGLATTYTYDVANKKTRVTNTVGRDLYENYNEKLAITSVFDNNAPEDENTEKTEYSETSAGETNPEKPKSSTDKYGNVTQYEYDANGNLTKTIYPKTVEDTQNPIETSTYDNNNNQLNFTDKAGATTWHIYENNRLIKTMRPINGTDDPSKKPDSSLYEITSTTYYPDGTYATDGLVKSETDPRGNVTSYTYDDQGRILTTTQNIDGKAYTTTNKYDNAGRLEFTIDPEGVRTEYIYSASDQTVLTIVADDYAVQDPKKTPRFDTKFTRTVYDGLGRTKQEIGEMQYKSIDDYLPVDLYRDPNVGTRYTYYSDGKLESQTDSAGNTTKYIYDKTNGNLVTEIQPNLSQKEYTYDDEGHKTSESFREKSTDKNAVILQTIDYSRGNVTETTDYLEGNQTAVTKEKYGWDGRLIEKTSPNGMIQRNKYDNAGRVKKEEYLNQNGTQVLNWIKYDYDPWGRVKEKESAFDSAVDTNSTLNAITTYTYDEHGNVKTEEVKNNAAGQAKSVSKTEYAYDTQGNKVMTAFYEGTTPVKYVQSVYDWSGKLLREYKGLSRKLTTAELNSTIQNPSTLGYSVIQNKYDGLGNCIEKIDAMGNVESYKYDKAGRITYTKDRNGAEHTVEYDSNGNPTIKTSKKSGAKTITKTYQYDSMGKQTTVTEDDKKIEYEYDMRGNQTKEIEGNVEKTFVYNTAGNVTNYIIKVDNVQKQSVKNTYDSMGNIGTVMENNVLKAKYNYDLFGRLIKTETYSNSQTTLTETNEYNYAGLVTRTVNTKVSGNVSSVLSQYDYTYYYDSNQRTKNDSTGTTSYTYDGQGQLIRAGADTASDNTSFENAVLITTEIPASVNINSANQVRYFIFTPTATGTYIIASTDNGSSDPYCYLYTSDGKQITYDDDSNGSRNFKIEYKLSAGTQYVIGAKMYSSGTGSYSLTITSDNTSIVNAVTIASGTPTNVSINVANQVRYFRFTPAATGTYVIGSTDNGSSDPYCYLYTSDGKQITYDDDSNGDSNFKISYTLNAGIEYIIGAKMYSSGIGRYALTITPPDNTALGNAMAITSGTPTSVSINAANQVRYFRFTPDTTANYIITSTDNGSSDPYGYLYASDGTQIAYNDDSNGNRNFKIECKLNAGTQYVIGAKMYSTGTGSYSFTISQQPSDTTVQEYSYDANGNRKTLKETSGGVDTETTYTYNNNDCLLTEKTGTQTIAYSYDANGNLLSKTGGATQTFDLLNRMTTWSGNGKNATYTYDSDNMRNSKSVNDGATTVNTKHVWINDEIALDIGNATISYVHGNKLIHSSAYGWYIYNAHGDVVQLADDSGTITQDYDYDPFGVQMGDTATAENNSYRYCGEYYDTESGYTYLRARYYDPKNGRFVSEDSVMDGDNWYVYCNNDPINHVDPTGHTYHSIDAVQYAMKWWDGKNNKYPDFKGRDCANFISQCVRAGGISMNKTWYCAKINYPDGAERGAPVMEEFTYSKAWIAANLQYKEFKQYSFVKREITIPNAKSIRKQVKKYKNVLRPGDLMYFDDNNNGEINHATMISFIDKDKGKLYYTAHAIPRYNQNLTTFFDSNKKGKVHILSTK